MNGINFFSNFALLSCASLVDTTFKWVMSVHMVRFKGLALSRSGTMATTSPGLGREEQEGLPRVSPRGLKARSRRAITEMI
jgi:hypothetical protein